MKLINQLLIVLVMASVVACSSPKPETTIQTDEEIMADALRMAQEYIMADGHVDIPYRLMNKMDDISVRTKDGHFDFVRAKEGGLDAPFMSIYIPSERENNGAKELADTLINLVEKIVSDFPDKYALAGSPAEVEANFAKGLISLPMGMENGAPIEGDLANLTYFHERGIRYITLTHAKDNHICDSSYDTTRTWQGLSPFGYDVVNEMNRIGIMVDISHVTDSTFYQVIRTSKAPLIASHSSCRKFTPGFERNMNDEMIKILGENDGVIHINFGSSFLDSAFQQAEGDPGAFTTVKMVADHIDHVVNLAGIDHVGFGSDFDGVSSLPRGLEDASMMPNLIFELLKRGYGEEDIAKICYRNTFRVWNKVEAVAKEMQAQG